MTSAWDLSPSERATLQAVGLVLEDTDSPPSSTDVRDRWLRLPPFDDSEPQLFYQALKRLEGAGFVTSTQHPQDGRQRVLGLTEDGEEALSAYAKRATAACGITGVNP